LDLAYDTARPTVALSSASQSLKSGEVATIAFAFNKDPGESFTLEDIAVEGGVLSGLSASASDSLLYQASFTPSEGFTGEARLSVADNRFQDAVSNFNRDGAEANNALSLSVDTRAPGLVISGFPSLSRLSGDSGSTAQVYPLTLTFSEDPGTSFVKADLEVTGGTLKSGERVVLAPGHKLAAGALVTVTAK
jgi:hypothetical protein